MNVFTLNVVVLMSTCVLSTAAAQSIYKCGDSYSQIPCPGAILIDASDKRSSDQKLQADANSKRSAQTADAMEKARLQQEKIDLASNTPPMKKVGNTSTSKTKSTGVKKKKNKKPLHKSTEKKLASQS